MNYKNWTIVIPARLGSTRLPNKPLQKINGIPLIVKVYKNLQQLKEKGIHITVATDSNSILELCQNNNIPCTMTDIHHKSGTDRCFEVSQKISKPFILNIQGDQPYIDIHDLENLMTSIENSSSPCIGTLVYKNIDHSTFINQNAVKAVIDKNNQAIYFSRSPIPFQEKHNFKFFLHHIGIYGFHREALTKFCNLGQSHLESIEKLEQLRAIENDIPIKVVYAQNFSKEIDTPEDLQEVQKT